MSPADPDDAQDAEALAALARVYGLSGTDLDLFASLAVIHDWTLSMLAEAIEAAAITGEVDPQRIADETARISVALHDRLVAERPDLGRLGDPGVATAVTIYCLGGSENLGAVLGFQVLVDTLAPLVPHQARPALAWMRGRGSDRAGFGLDAEQAYEKALSLDPSFAPALESVASCAIDRGDLSRALMLLERAGVDPDDGVVRLLREYAAPEVVPLRRNDPCWCGSGRRLKQCHRGDAPLPLTRRATLLYHKASAFLQDGPWREELIALAQERTRYGNAGSLWEALADPLLMSAMLFEGSVIEEYLDTRGPLLPEDELALLDLWVDIDRGLYEVEEVRRGEGLGVRNVLDGERVFVHEVLGTEQAWEGMLFVTLVLPVGEGRWGFFGGIEPVSPAQRTQVIALLDDLPEPLELVSVLTDRFAPMSFTTTTGDPMEPCTTIIRVGGRRRIDAVLDRCFSANGDGTWTASVTGGAISPGATVGGTLTLGGRQITISTLSRERMDLLLDVLSDNGLPYVIESEEVLDIAQMLAEHREQEPAPLAGEHADPGLPENPELAEFLRQHILRYEQEWLDMDIPALGGMTPRQAAIDPVMRRDLIALINSLGPATPNTMDPQRLREALDL